MVVDERFMSSPKLAVIEADYLADDKRVYRKFFSSSYNYNVLLLQL